MERLGREAVKLPTEAPSNVHPRSIAMHEIGVLRPALFPVIIKAVSRSVGAVFETSVGSGS